METHSNLQQEQQLLTFPEAAGRLRICTHSLRRWIKSGKLPIRVISLGSRRLLAAEDVDAILTGRALDSTKPQTTGD